MNNEFNPQEIIARIRTLMGGLQLSQKQLAQLLRMDNSNLSKYLNGRLALSDAFINSVAIGLAVDKQWLLTGQSSRQNSGAATEPADDELAPLAHLLTGCRLTPMTGHDMEPTIAPGDLLAVTPVSDTRLIFWGKIYRVQLPDFTAVKRLRRHPDPAMLILHSDNPACDDMDVPRSMVTGLQLVRHIIHVESLI